MTTLLRPYWRDQYETYPVLLSRHLSHGMERIIVRVSTRSLLSAAKEERRRPGAFDSIASECWLPTPKPLPRDIVKKGVLHQGVDQSDLFFIVKRGHYLLSSLLLEHEEVTFREGVATCSCHPEESWNIDPHSLTGWREE